MKKALKTLKAKFEEYPLETVIVCAFAVQAATKLIEAGVHANNSRTWEKEVDRRVKVTA